MRIDSGYAGAQAAADHANRVTPEWEHIAYREALTVLVGYSPGHVFNVITTKLLRYACENRGVPKPPDARAWGNITRRLVREGKLVDTGTRVKLGSHGREIVAWRVT